MLNILNKIIVLFAGCFIAFSCSDPLDKSVVEPLEAKEIDRVVRKDKSFLATYSIVEEKWNYIHSAEDSARWSGITYNRLHNYLTTIDSPQLKSPLVTQLRERWEKMYNDHLVQADTIIKEWREYLYSHSADSLVKIEFDGIEVERIRNAQQQIDTLLKVKIKITPLKFAIDSLIANYNFTTASHHNGTVKNAPDDSIRINPLTINKKLKEPRSLKLYPDLPKDIKEKLIANDSTIVFNYTLFDIYAGGKSYITDSLLADMPKSVQTYLLAEKYAEDTAPVFDHKFYIENIIKELVNESFISQSAYIKINSEHYYREIDSLVFNFINYKGL